MNYLAWLQAVHTKPKYNGKPSTRGKRRSYMKIWRTSTSRRAKQALKVAYNRMSLTQIRV